MGQNPHADRMQALARMSGKLAHDFNNLLTTISGYTELMLMGLSEGDANFDEACAICKAADRAADLTRKLLAFSGRQGKQIKATAPEALLPGWEARIRRTGLGPVSLEIDRGAELPEIAADAELLGQLVDHLVANAIEAMPDGGTVQLSVQVTDVPDGSGFALPAPAGRYGVIAVTDSGEGMSEEVLAQAFEPFFSTRDRGKGTGLGLSLVHGIVVLHGGGIEVVTAPGEGTAVRCHIPLATE